METANQDSSLSACHTGTSARQQVPQTVTSKGNNTMKVQTSRFGVLEIDDAKIITMTQPFLGFPDSNRFILQPHGPESPCMWMQSLDEPGLAFVVIPPATIHYQYRPELPKYVKDELQADESSTLDTLVILTIPRDDPSAVTANLLGPVAINVNKRLAKQVLLDPLKYDCCWPIGSKAA